MQNRRELLSAATAALGVSLGGCLGSPSYPSNPFEVPSPDECTQSDRPMPDPVAGYEPQPYPDPPDEFSAATAEEFALAYERAILFNTILAESVSETTDEFNVEVDSGRTTELGAGHLVGFNYLAYTTDEDDAHADYWGAMVYFIAPRVAVRAAPTAENIQDVSLQSCDCTVLGTVYCR